MAVYLACGNNVGVVLLKWACSKFFTRALHAIIYFSIALSSGPGSAPEETIIILPTELARGSVIHLAFMPFLAFQA